MSDDVTISSSNDTVYLFNSLSIENAIGSAIILVVSVVGIAANGLSAFLLLRLSAFRNSFGLLASCHAIGNCGVLAAFLLWASPTSIFGIPDVPSWNRANLLIGQASLFFQTNSFHSTVFISINRLVAIAFPSTYSVFVFSFAAFIDLLTLTRLHSANTKLSQVRHNQSNASSDAARRQKKEVLFFVQSFVNTILYCFMLVCFHIIAPLEWVSSNRFTSFLSTTFIWEISHALGGVILVGFNREIHRRIRHPRDLLNSETIQAKATTTIQHSTLSAQPVYKAVSF
ncbi:hypothetical protein WR25_13834 [Diploscapter pachys]|uniref:7TM GPCR serpentine receptor class x (Srx) domain-containing protein n=1 Tax=Diploscapter pachys TaxID=2018661 RepID=A0A2A2KKD8_9BILA|nr:hypothetical protein WR25_13834 [Diploscapter pachys]